MSDEFVIGGALFEFPRIDVDRGYSTGSIQETLPHSDDREEEVDIKFSWQNHSNVNKEWKSGFWIQNYA